LTGAVENTLPNVSFRAAPVTMGYFAISATFSKSLKSNLGAKMQTKRLQREIEGLCMSLLI
jgi:hypothetical protein